VDIAGPNQVTEARIDEEDQVISRVSVGTLEFMYRYGLALERRLRRHRGNLHFIAEEEHDLFEGMRLATRLKKVDRNIRRVDGRNERLRFEIVRREAQRRPAREGSGRRFSLCSGEETWNGRTGHPRDSVLAARA
jgi:hypothetical protein